MQVLKFGGSSVANAKNINKVISIVKDELKIDKTVVVCSAISGCTDELIAIGNEALAQNESYIERIHLLEERHIRLIEELISEDDTADIKTECHELFNELREICKGVFLLKELSDLSLSHIVSFGEILSTKIISAKFASINISHIWKDSRELIKTEFSGEKNSVIMSQTLENIRNFFEENTYKLYILPGFIATDEKGRTTTLGRGGSDYTASIIAVGSQARILEIWTDVCGMMTADPRIVPGAQTIRNISYKEALELSHFGAKVIYPPTIQPVVKHGIPIYVKNTFDPTDPGTLIERNPPEGQSKIKGISSSNRIALLSMEGSGMIGIPGYSSRLFATLTENNVNIILITQASSVHTMCIAIEESDADKAKKAADETFAYEISLGKVEPLRVEKGFSIISLVGDDMKNQSGASGRMFEALGREGINIRAIAQGSSEKNVSAVIQTDLVNEGIRCIHKEFFSEKSKRLNLFIAGYGTVGKALVDIILAQKGYIYRTQGKELVICGLCNSKKFIADKNGLNFISGEDDIQAQLSAGERNVDNAYIKAICGFKLSDSIFVDCTANRTIAGSYKDLFCNKVSVVACNKIANSLNYETYQSLFETAVEEGVSYRYETTVCAAMPVLATIRQIVTCGDRISRMEGIVSGTLNYLFSTYNTQKSFAQLVKEARELGYTEPDPRLDLSGTDVLRKFIISAREAGEVIEAADIDFQGFIPEEILKGGGDFAQDADTFYAALEAYEPTLKAAYEDAAYKGCKLRFIALLDKTQTKPVYRIALAQVAETHPFYGLEGSDNAMLIATEFYPNGVLIKGAGAGARQTASGLLNDILL